MKQSVQVAHLVNGETLSVRTLSGRVERRAATLAALVVLGLTAGAGAALAAGLALAHRIVLGPAFVGLWSALGVALAAVAAGRARRRTGRYLIGIDIDDDAFSSVPATLVRREGAGYVLTVASGMSATIDHERSARAIDLGATAADGLGRRHVALGPGSFAEVVVGRTNFAVRARAEEPPPTPLPTGFWRPLVKRVLVPMELAAVVAFLLTVPAGALLTEQDMRSAIPADATPWEVEKLLRQEAQTQAATLGACFDPLPLGCQHPGYVGVGVSLAKDGEIRASWIARSTYGQECPVDACMSNVVSGWFFEPIPETMRIVLPVQVLRTNRPLPPSEHLGLGPSSSPAGAPRNGLN